MSHVALLWVKMGISNDFKRRRKYGVRYLCFDFTYSLILPITAFPCSELGIPICCWQFFSFSLDHKYFLFLSLKVCCQVKFFDLYFSLDLAVHYCFCVQNWESLFLWTSLSSLFDFNVYLGTYACNLLPLCWKLGIPIFIENL